MVSAISSFANASGCSPPRWNRSRCPATPWSDRSCSTSVRDRMTSTACCGSCAPSSITRKSISPCRVRLRTIARAISSRSKAAVRALGIPQQPGGRDGCSRRGVATGRSSCCRIGIRSGMSLRLFGRMLAACGITCLQLSLPYHDERRTPGVGFARELVCENLGLTLRPIGRPYSTPAHAWLGSRWRDIGASELSGSASELRSLPSLPRSTRGWRQWRCC